ncbi:imelysin family protein [Luteolibacter sp. LG18]|uniref:imelysin family protein n=1 Tax=Luteolibacter sp. LG18 TaxID=2819286 RepID=UPI002B2A8EF4|nr:hypothetical protein llg_39910 [Luteolibacter sp. LG18]
MKLPFVFLTVLCAIVLPREADAAETAVHAPKTAKDQMLHTLVETAIAPGYAKLAEACGLLEKETRRFEEQPDLPGLERARDCWRKAAEAAQEIDCCRVGPILEGDLAATFFFLPTRPGSVEKAILAMKQDDVDLSSFGAAAKGLYAIEYLLFPKDVDAAATLALFEESKRRHYLHAIAAEAAERSGRLARSWQESYSPAATAFLNGGQDSLNALVNRMVMTAEAASVTRLSTMLNPPERATRDKVPGAASGHSHVLLQAVVRGLRRVHEAGMGAHVKKFNPELAARLDQRFQETIAALSKLEKPLESQGPDTSALMESTRQCNQLAVLLKVDLASSLGVTLTFISTDGD